MTCYTPSIIDGTTIGLIIEPFDTVFFRDGRPFGAGDYARGGLPMPQTLYGMIQKHVRDSLGLMGKSPHQERKDGDPWHRSLAVRGPWLAKRKDNDRHQLEDVYTPCPGNLMKKGKDKNADKVLLKPLHPDVELPGWKGPSWDGQGALRPILSLKADEKLESVDGLLSSAGLKEILNGRAPSKAEQLVTMEHLCLSEGRTGVGIDAGKGTAKDGLLYSAMHLRLKETTVFYAEIGMENEHSGAKEQLKELFPESGTILSFGGEGRRVIVRPMKEAFSWPAADKIPSYDAGGYTTQLITPGIFGTRTDSNGEAWHPPHIASLRAALVGKPLPVSGWNLAGNSGGTPKPTRYAVPAGSIYYWQQGKNADPEKKPLHQFQLTHQPLAKAHGWGFALRGVWEWER